MLISLGELAQTAVIPIAVEQLMPVVHRMAGQFKRLLPSAELDDLVQCGMVALVQSARDHRGREDEFRPATLPLIRHAMLDALPALSSPPFELCIKMGRIRRCRRGLAQHFLRPPSSREIARAIGISHRHYQRILRDYAQVRTIGSIESLRTTSSRLHGNRLEESFGFRRFERLSKMIDELPLRQRLILEYRYRDALTLKAIGAMFGLSESRVCQLLKNTLSVLRTRQQRRGPLVCRIGSKPRA